MFQLHIRMKDYIHLMRRRHQNSSVLTTRKNSQKSGGSRRTIVDEDVIVHALRAEEMEVQSYRVTWISLYQVLASLDVNLSCATTRPRCDIRNCSVALGENFSIVSTARLLRETGDIDDV